MTPEDFRNRTRHPAWERELAAHVRTLPATDRLEFVRRFTTIDFVVAMDLIRKCVSDRPSRLALLDDALKDGRPRNMKYWLAALVPALGLRRVERYVEAKSGVYPAGAGVADYALSGFRRGTHDKYRPKDGGLQPPGLDPEPP